MSKSLLFAAGFAVAVIAVLSAQSGSPPGSGAGSGNMVGIVEVHIDRSTGTHTLGALNSDTYLAQVAHSVQSAYKGQNHTDVTPTFMAGYLAGSYEDVVLLPGEVKYEWRKNVNTCELEKYCIVCDLLAVGDPARPDDPVLVAIENTSILK